MPNEYTHVKTAIAELGEKSGMRNGAVADEFADLHWRDYEVRGDKLVHKRTGLEAEKHINDVVREERPHLFPVKIEDDLEYQAFGPNPNMTARAKLSRMLSAHDFAEKMKHHGLKSITDMRPGKSRDTDNANPWKTNDRARQIEVIKSLGTRVAADLAKSAGVTLTGQPLRGRA